MIELSHHEVDSKDPHIWTSPINVKQIAKNIYITLSNFDKNSSSFYKKNLDNYLKELDKLDKDIRVILKDTSKGSSFMVFHPAWGYFAKEYNLTELPVEIEGKEPKMRELIKLIKEAKKIGFMLSLPNQNFQINRLKLSPRI